MTASEPQPCLNRRLMPKITREVDDANLLRPRGHLIEHAAAAIGRAVIDEDDLRPHAKCTQSLPHATKQACAAHGLR